MEFIGSAVTDIGISKSTNKDSILIKIARTKMGRQIALGIICDGMGGLEKGEVASATVIKEYERWFQDEMPQIIKNISLEMVAQDWIKMLKNLNYKIMNYGKSRNINLGTTFSAILIVDKQYLIVHVGDSRIYKITDTLDLLTEDQTFVQREVNRGTMTLDEAQNDSRRNILLQCIGASPEINPETIFGEIKENTSIMLCSDGFRHVLTENEMYSYLNPNILIEKEVMMQNSKQLVELVKKRDEKDNVTVGIIKCVL